jgi:hypothetical protein
MAVVWSAVCALAALAAGVQQAQGADDGPRMRTRTLPGHGYVRYEVLPGDEETEPGQVIVIHEERRPAPKSGEAGGDEALSTARDDVAFARARQSACSPLRAKLLARVFEMQGMQIEPELAAWLERNLDLGSSGVKTIQLLGGDPLLVTALKVDGVARGLAEDLARCEQRQAR